jgi:hypothetical protein
MKNEQQDTGPKRVRFKELDKLIYTVIYNTAI